MKNPNNIKIIAAILSAATLLATAPAQLSARPRTSARSGFMLGAMLGPGFGNFDLEANDAEGDTGALFAAFAGYAWPNGFALTADLSRIDFEYQATVLGLQLRYALSFTMAAPCAWYVFDLNRDWVGYVRAGLGVTKGRAEFIVTTEDDAEGLLLGGGAAWYFSDAVAMTLDLTFRNYGIKFTDPNFKEEDVQVTALTLGVLWR